MKKILLIPFTLFALLSCSGSGDTNVSDGSFAGPYTLQADKTLVEADGSDRVTFSLLDASGNDVLKDPKAIWLVNIVSDEGMRVKKAETSTAFIADGTYNFYARYQGQESVNKIQVTAQNRKQYETFHKNVAIYKATAIGCGPCAAMTKTLGEIGDDAKAHSVELCWHYGPEIGGISDWFALQIPGFSYDCGTMIANTYGGGGVPTVVFDLVETLKERSVSTIEEIIWNQRAKYPATCGIKLETRHEDGKIEIDAELTSSTGGEYDLGFAVLLNNQTVEQGTNYDKKYTHIVCAASGNFMMYSNSIKTVEKDGKMSVSQTVPVTGSIEDFSVVAFAIVKHGDAARIDNIVEVKAGESISYIYNE